jgi:Ser/Thr protein kinase RdoA (MazF antagonist)
VVVTGAGSPDRRIRSADLDGLVRRLAGAYGLGRVLSSSVITLGYEDCNLDVVTESGRYVAKVFAAGREARDIERYVSVLEAVEAAPIAHPRLHRTSGAGSLLHEDDVSGDAMVVMDHVDGTTYLALGRAPTPAELVELMEQVAAIHDLRLPLPQVYDPWAVPHIDDTFGTVRSLLDPEETRLVSVVADAVRRTDHDGLPHAVVHEDLAKANVMVSTSGRVHVLDFGGANHLPRVQDLAVVAANLLYDGTTPLQDRVDRVADAHVGRPALGGAERRALVTYACGVAALEFLCAMEERHLEGNTSAENDFLLELGRSQLPEAAALVDDRRRAAAARRSRPGSRTGSGGDETP